MRKIVPAAALVRLDPDAIARQATGILVEAEARRLVTTSFNLTKEESAAIDSVVSNPETIYEHRGDFLRHAVVELLNAWVRSGFPSDYVDDLVNHLRDMRSAAYRLRLRQNFQEVLDVYEVTLEQTLTSGDIAGVVEVLTVLRGYVDRTPSVFWKEHLQKTLARSRNVQHAIGALYEAARGDKRLAKEAETWNHWLESLLS